MCSRAEGHAVVGLDLVPHAVSDAVCDVRTIGLEAAWQAVLTARAQTDATPLNKPKAVALV